MKNTAVKLEEYPTTYLYQDDEARHLARKGNLKGELAYRIINRCKIGSKNAYLSPPLYEGEIESTMKALGWNPEECEIINIRNIKKEGKYE